MQIGWYRTLLVIIIVLVNIGCDQQTKKLAEAHLALGAQYAYIGDTFRLSYVENQGAFLSMGAGLSENVRTWALKVFPVVLLLALLVYTILSKNLTLFQVIAFSFILGGGVSNIYDRLMYGQVIDFMNIGIGRLRTGIFNFADVSIMVGLFMMLPYIFQGKKTTEEEKHNKESE
jgi:signal peptidase II